MRTSRPARSGILPALTTTLALLALFTAEPLAAQAQVQAFYPLLTDLLDATNNYGPVMLTGTPPPAPPNNGVCHNGIYFYNAGGQDIRTPLLPTLNTTDFEIDVDFNITAMPTFQSPVIMGGHLWRWLGIYLQSNGTVGIKHNNSNLLWSQTVLSTGLWYSASLKYESGTVALVINGNVVLHAAIGPLSDGNNKNVTTNDYSNGGAFNGCIRSLLIVNDTSLLATATPFGTGCSGSAGVPALGATNLPQIGTTFTLSASSLPPAASLAFLSIGSSRTTSLLGPLPLSLQPFGLGAGCNLLVSADSMLLFGVTGGTGTFGIAVPPNNGLIGLALYFQAASIDPAATGGIAVSNGIAISVGF